MFPRPAGYTLRSIRYSLSYFRGIFHGFLEKRWVISVKPRTSTGGYLSIPTGSSVTYSPPTHTVWAKMSTSIGYNQWLSPAKPCLKVLPAGRNRSLVTRTNKCGWATSDPFSPRIVSLPGHLRRPICMPPKIHRIILLGGGGREGDSPHFMWLASGMHCGPEEKRGEEKRKGAA